MSKISQYPDGGAVQSSDQFVVARGGANYSLLGSNMGGGKLEGLMQNGKLSVTVASNNITVAIKTFAGADPSASDPVDIYIGGVERSITSALSRTLAAATNWMNLGSAELATKEVDLFSYLVWDSNSSAVGLTFARIPHACLVSDFSSTTTNEKYCAGYSDFTSTDDVVNIGRFAATLSAGAGYTWSVPTFTSKNLRQVPTFITRWLDFTPQWSGSGSMTVTGVTAPRTKYQLFMGNCHIDIVVTAFTIGGTPSTVINQTNPFSYDNTASNNPLISAASIVDSGGLIMGYTRGDTSVLSRCGYVKSTGANYAAGAGTFINSKGSFTI